MLKTYNQLDIEQLGICTFKLRHIDKGSKCQYFVVPGDSTALLGIPDIKVLSILRITQDTIGEPNESRRFDSQTIDI